VLLVKVIMAADAAWVTATVIAAADKAIRIDIEETPKGKERKPESRRESSGKQAQTSREIAHTFNEERYGDM
jgi:hypothetical protein